MTDTAATVKATVMRNVMAASLVVAENADLSLNVRMFPALSIWSDPELDYKSKIVSCRATGLQPDTQYYYALELDGVIQGRRWGKFRTFPAEGTKSNFSFAFGSCSSNFKWRFLTGGLSPEAFLVIPQEPGVLFFVHLGDFYYDIGDNEISERLEKYDRVMERPELGAFHQSLPFAYVWDDHDFLGNNAEGGRETKRALAKIALEAYSLYMPHYELLPGSDGVYQSFTVGRVLFILTDSRFNRTPRKETGSTGKTILGTNQRTWLKAKLLEGKQYDLIVWGNSIPWVGEEEPKSDYWAGYAAERHEISEFIKANDVRNLCMISGDAHMLAIDDGRNTGFATPDANGGRGGFPVFHAASLESKPSEKGGPYSIGGEDGLPGSGIPGRRQYGVMHVEYPLDKDGQPTGTPHIRWSGKRAAKGSGDVADAQTLLGHEFEAGATYSGF